MPRVDARRTSYHGLDVLLRARDPGAAVITQAEAPQLHDIAETALAGVPAALPVGRPTEEEPVVAPNSASFGEGV
jgi:hypothetical protein